MIVRVRHLLALGAVILTVAACAAETESDATELESVMTGDVDRDAVMERKELQQLLDQAAAAGPEDEETVAQQLLAERESLDNNLRETIRTEASSAKSCQVLPVGAKPCGGPRAHLVYSAEGTDQERLAQLAVAYTEIDRALVKLTGEMSDCRMEQAPRVALEDGHCVAVDSTRTRAADR